MTARKVRPPRGNESQLRAPSGRDVRRGVRRFSSKQYSKYGCAICESYLEVERPRWRVRVNRAVSCMSSYPLSATGCSPSSDPPTGQGGFRVALGRGLTPPAGRAFRSCQQKTGRARQSDGGQPPRFRSAASGTHASRECSPSSRRGSYSGALGTGASSRRLTEDRAHRHRRAPGEY
jgi:hypothetical protein